MGDSRLDHLLEDLENSTQRSHSVEKTTTSFASASSQSTCVQQSGVLSKSKSTSSLTGAATDNMLKDLDTALKASTNYIESHRSVQLPNGHQEYHESRYTSTSGVPPSSTGDFNLERQVQHMMPSNYSTSLSSANGNGHNQHYSGLQSANMVSSMQTSSSKQSYTSYKVQSNSYTSRHLDSHQQEQDQDRPGSRLKANIDELDTLLSDLNNAQNTNSRHQETSSEDYGDQGMMQGQVKKTITSMNEYTMSAGGSSCDYNRKPPSPSPKRRTPVMCSPVPRRSGPSPAGRKVSPPPSASAAAGMTSNTMSSSNYSYNYNSSRNSSPPRKRSPSPRMDSATPTGHAYYSKYHSSYSQNQHHSNGPASFPSCPSPSPNRGPSIQTPPKKVDDLMTELSEFDPSIQHTGFKEPVAPARSKYSSSQQHQFSSSVHHDEELDSRYKKREPSPIRPVQQPAAPSGPAVYYPPGELFSSTRNNETLNSDISVSPIPPADQSHAATMETTSSSRGRAKMRAEYGYKEKGRYSEGDTKQGAAVVPICLPLCCAAPCVIL